MSVQDLIKKSILESGVFDGVSITNAALGLLTALIMGAVIYFVYRKFYTGVIYSRSFAVTLVGMTVLTAMVTLAISTNIVISLGMVGALSIVRFRTAIKDPLDLLYLFWAITTGITAGAGMYVQCLNRLRIGGTVLDASQGISVRERIDIRGIFANLIVCIAQYPGKNSHLILRIHNKVYILYTG